MMTLFSTLQHLPHTFISICGRCLWVVMCVGKSEGEEVAEGGDGVADVGGAGCLAA